MTFKSLALAAATVAMLSGAAYAQTQPDETKTGSTSATGSSALDDKELMTPFYTDESMTTLRTGDEFAAAFNAMSSEDKERVRAACEHSTSPRDGFCQALSDVKTQ